MRSYVYMINYLEYGDSCYFPIFSHKKFSDVEFKRLCKAAHKTVSEKYFYTISPVATGDVCRLIRDQLCEDYPHLFFKKDVTGYVVNDGGIADYSYF